MPTFVLAFDGGGARVVLQWRILQRVLEVFPDLLKQVTVFAGTSAGAILASLLALGMEQMIPSVMTDQALGALFDRSCLHKFTSVDGLIKAKYENENLRQMLQANIGQVYLADVPRSLFITAFSTVGLQQQQRHVAVDHHLHLVQNDVPIPEWLNMRCSRWHNLYFHNFVDSRAKDDLVEIIMKSAAAPTYFPMVDHTVDGGIANNNPSLCVTTNLIALGVPLEDIYVLSLGSGEKPRELASAPNASLGLLQWIPSLVNMIFDANSEAISHSCFHILCARFHRVNPVLQDDIALDAVGEYLQLVAIADALDLEPTLDWIERATDTARKVATTLETL